MLILLTWVLLFSGADHPCEAPFAAAREAQEAAADVTRQDREVFLLRALESIGAARACYAGQVEKESAFLLSWEAYDLLELNRPMTAEAVLDSFFTRYAHAAPNEIRSYTLSLRGGLQLTSGRLLDALTSYHEALSSTDPGDFLSTAEHRINIATVLQRLSDYGKATETLTAAENDLRHIPEGDFWGAYMSARVLSQQADMALQWATRARTYAAPDLAAAERKATQAAEAYETLSLPSEAALALTQAAEAAAFQGALSEAESLLERALRLGTAAGGNYAALAVRYKGARLLMQRGEHKEAISIFLSLQELSHDDSPDLSRRIAHDLGFLFEKEHNWAEAEKWFRKAIQETEQFRAAAGTTPWATMAFVEWQEPYRGLVRVLTAQKSYDAALAELERLRARGLRDLQEQNSRLSRLSPEQRHRADSLNQALLDVRQRLGGIHLASTDRPALERAEITTQAAISRLFGVPEPQTPFEKKQIQARLAGDGGAILSYFIDHPDPLFREVAKSFVFVLTPDTLAAVQLATGSAALQDLLAAISPVLATNSSVPGLSTRQFDLAALHEAFELLIAPVKHLLPAGTPLTVIPDGPLFALPFPALVSNAVAPYDYGNARYLIEDHTLETEIAVHRLRHGPQAASADADLLAIGRSLYAGRMEWNGAAALADLPYAKEEISDVCRWASAGHCYVDEPDAEAILAREANAAGIIHLAAHSLLRPQAPLYSALLLSDAEGSAPYDGVLHAYELSHTFENVGLVVLSSCGTAQGTVLAGEGMQSLQYAFRAAGVQSTVSMLWAVDDGSTQRLLETFYRSLAKQGRTSPALREAQLAYLGKAASLERNPFFWAAPVLYGDPGHLDLHTGYGRVAVLFFFVTAALSAAAIYLVRRRLHSAAHRTVTT